MISSPSMSRLGSTESLSSDVESLVSIGTNDATIVYHIPEDAYGNKLFESGDSDFDICVNGTTFHTHKYLLKRFGVLRRLIEQRPAGYKEELPLDHDPTDFVNVFKILYAPFIEGVPEFDSATLVSTLRIATAYDYPVLRTFAIKKLEAARPSAIERIRIAREFGLTSWEPPAYEELCTREEPILEAEANVLGISAFVQVARIREQHQRRKGETNIRHENTGNEAQDTRVGEPILGEQVEGYGTKDTPRPQEHNSAIEVEYVTTGGALEGTEVENKNEETTKKVIPEFKPSFIRASSEQPHDRTSKFSKNTGALRYEIPGCQCHRGTPNSTIYTKCDCKIPPCVGDAFEQLQASQIAQSASIAQLESAIRNVKASFIPREPTVIAENSILPPNELQPTFVQTEIQKWLTTRR